MHHQHDPKMMKHHYRLLALMAVLSFIAMYILMYAMVDRFSNVYPNVNQAYMAALMTAPMIVIELLLMGMMYQNKRWNLAIYAAVLVLGIGAFTGIRQQTLVGDREFIRSMVPHHSAAILMCRKASLTDPELMQLCEHIRVGQQAEIDQMDTILARLKR